MIFLKSKKLAKKILSVVMAVLILALPLTQVASAIVVYPVGVTREKAVSAIEKTDVLIENLIKQLNGGTLADMILPEIYQSDEMLSKILVMVYQMIAQEGSSLSAIGLDSSVSAAASGLTAYPEVYNKLITYSTWDTVDLTGVSWGVSDKYQFVDAISAMLSPFNDVIYALLCGDTYKINFLLSFKGDYGYSNAVVPMLQNFGCQYIKDEATFYAQAAVNKNTMMSNILLDLLYFVEQIMAAPAKMLSENLPNIAYFLNNGEFSSIITKLIEPIQIQVLNIGGLVSGGLFSTLTSFLDDPSSVTESGALDDMLGDFLGESEFKMAELDLELMASCGDVVDGKVVANVSDSFILIMRFLIDTLKLNLNNLASITGQDSAMIDSIKGLFDIETDELIAVIVNLLTNNKGMVNNFQWTYAPLTTTALAYTPNLTQENFVKMASGIDALLAEIMTEMGEDSMSLKQSIANSMYSSELITPIIVGVYALLADEQLEQVMGILNMSLSPKSVAGYLKHEQFNNVRQDLLSMNSWNDLGDKKLDWGFKAGDKKGFINTLSYLLSPLAPIINMAFAEGKLEILGAIDVYGSNAYETAIIPLLENLGVKSENIKSYSEYKLTANSAQGITDIVESICTLLDDVIEHPIYTVTSIIPNIVYFLENGGLKNCINNILFPLNEIAETLGLSETINSMLDQYTNVDILTSLMESMPELIDGLSLSALDLTQFSGYGVLVEKESKATYLGQPSKMQYVQANQGDVLLTIFRYLVDAMKVPGNDQFLTDLLSGVTSSNEMFASFSGQIATQLQAMSTDETIEWIYNIFFYERPVVPEVEKEEYVPTIVYKEEKEISPYVYVIILCVFVVLGYLAYKNKEKILEFINTSKQKIKNKKQDELS